jgi:hypothetical protein
MHNYFPRTDAAWIKKVWRFWPLWLLIIIGLVRAVLTYNIWFDFTDQSTFFIFGRLILHGEVIYKDFVHFRTPGLYFLSALFQWAFGSTLGTEQLLLSLESYVLYPALLYLAAWLITRRRWVAFTLGLIAAWLPAVLQDRAGLALMAVAAYIISLSAKNPREERRWLLGSGLLLGASFTFGQDSAIVALGAILLSELRFRLARRPLLLRRMRSLALGTGIALLPLLLYVILLSNIKNFLYYVFEYALVIQPNSMDLIYPSFFPPTSLFHLMFYIPFLILIVSFGVFYLADELNVINLPVLVFATLGLVTPLGRSDESHLVYALPPLLLLIPLAAASVAKIRITRTKALALSGWVVATVIILKLSTTRSSFFVAGVAIVFTLASLKVKATDLFRPSVWKEEKGSPRPAFDRRTAALTFGGWVLVVLVFAPYIYSFAWAPLKVGWERHFGPDKQLVTPTNTVSGVPVEGAPYFQLSQIQNVVNHYHPSVIFSYPVQPFYYSLAPKHATRFITFETETTPAEQREAIADLQKNKPQLVIMDVAWADGDKQADGQINQYIEANYKPVADVNYTVNLEILVPRQ